MLCRVSRWATPHLLIHRPLYVGMRLLLFSKDCACVGFMNDCEWELAGIVFTNSEEDFPDEAPVGKYSALQCMPTSLQLCAPGAAWKLPTRGLPAIPPGVSRLGLFQLCLSTPYLRRCVKKGTYIDMCRAPCPVLPVDTPSYLVPRWAFGAVAVVMARPPRMHRDMHWLAGYAMLLRPKSLEVWLLLRPAELDDLSRPPLAADMGRLSQLEVKGIRIARTRNDSLRERTALYGRCWLRFACGGASGQHTGDPCAVGVA